MIRKTLCMLLVLIVLCVHPTYATPPSNPHIESGTAIDGGNYFEYNASFNGGSGWKDLKTPPHWVVETGEIAYCLEHMEDSPHGESYVDFNPTTVYSQRTYKGLLAILEHSYPYRNAGLSDSQIKYATSNAIRAWLRESAGIGYNFMLPSNNAVRPKKGAYQSAFNFYKQLLDKARNGSVINHTLTAHPSTIELQVKGDKLVGKTTIRYPVLNGKYKINMDKLPEEVNISGYAGNNGEVLTITAPISMIGQTIEINNLFTGYDNRCPANISWLDNSSGHQAVVVPVVDKMSPVVTTGLTLKSTPSTVTVIKHGKDDSSLLGDAVFGVYRASNNLIIEQLTTDSNGKATSGNLDIGDYYLKEIAPPVGYVLDDTSHTLSITSTNRQIVLDIYNSPLKGRVSIVKTDEAGNPLQGIVFGLYNCDDSLIEELTTDEEGKTTSKDLLYGEYYLKELSTLKGYNLDNTPIPLKIVDNDQTVELSIINKAIRGKVKITKTDENNTLLNGAVYGVYDTNDILVDEITTDKDGIALSNDLLYGNYYLKEIMPPIGYIVNTTPLPFQIVNQGQIIELTAHNTRIHGKVQILKTGETDNPLKDAVYGIYDTNDTLIEELTTDENGLAISNDLIYGDYYLKEITPPIGYNLNETPIPFGIREDSVTVELAASNTHIRGRVQILKTGEIDNPLQGAIYGVFDTSDTLIDEFTTDEYGIAISTELIYGDYYLKEISPPIGYNLNETPLPFQIREQGVTIELNADNTKIQGRIQAIKSGEKQGQYLQGAEFGIYTLDGELVYTLTTDLTGQVTSELLDYENYYLQEIAPPLGYVIDNTKHPFSIESNEETIVMNVSNTWIRGQVEILKTDIETGKPLNNATFGIYNMADELIEEIITDNNGYAISTPLIYGKYYIKELQPPIGYNLNEEIFPFSIEQDQQIIHFDIENVIIKGRVKVTKTSASDNSLLEGVVFGVFTQDNSLIDELKTNKNGVALSSDLKYGEYYLKELSVPDGYILDNIHHPFSITENKKTIEIDIQNQPVVGNVEIYYRHVKHAHELSAPYSYIDWIGQEYIPWVNSNRLDKKQLEGYRFIRADYPKETVLIDGKLIITYWYDDPVKVS